MHAFDYAMGRKWEESEDYRQHSAAVMPRGGPVTPAASQGAVQLLKLSSIQCQLSGTLSSL